MKIAMIVQPNDKVTCIQPNVELPDLDLEAIAYTVCRLENWSIEKVDRVERDYRTFLHLVRVRGCAADIAPTVDVDVFWHYHILDTEKYMSDCQRLFGGYLHHYPYSGIFGEADAAAQLERVRRTAEVLEFAELSSIRDSSPCTPHEPGGPPACQPGPHCVANNRSDFTLRPTRGDMLKLVRPHAV